VGNTSAGINFLGQDCQNPLLRELEEGTNKEMANYSYEYDLSGRISKISIKGTGMIPWTEDYVFPLITNHQVMEYTYY
jgi:hypothetical protein